MTSGEFYRRRAAELRARAVAENSLSTRSELEVLANSYLRLSDQADRNSVPREIVYETPERSLGRPPIDSGKTFD